MYLYLKAIHIIFVVTWFAGLFYFPRLLIYNVEAHLKPEPEQSIIHRQLNLMMRRLWYAIVWPSAILTLLFGLLVLFKSGLIRILLEEEGRWLLAKLFFVFFLYLYQFSLHLIFKQQLNGRFKYTSQQLRIWNEMAAVFLVSIVMLVVVKQNISALWGVIGLLFFVVALVSAIRIYKGLRK